MWTEPSAVTAVSSSVATPAPAYSEACERLDRTRIIGSGIRIKLGTWRVNPGDRHLASSLVAGDPRELGELTLFATLTQTQTWAFGEFGLKLYTEHCNTTSKK